MPRVRRKNVTEEEWIAHRKYRKKIASAKWYATKKEEEIKEENQLRKQLYKSILAPRATQRLWTETQHAEYQAVIAFHKLGYPSRPDDVCALQWKAWLDSIENGMKSVQESCTWKNVPWNEYKFQKAWRQLCMRESLDSWRSHNSSTRSHNNSCWSRVQAWLQSHGCVPAMCSEVGVVFVELFLQNRVSEFEKICRVIQNVLMTSNTQDQTQECPAPHIKPPTQNPNKKLYLENAILQKWIQECVFVSKEEDSTGSIATTGTDWEEQTLLLDQYRFTDTESDDSSATSTIDPDDCDHEPLP